MTNLSQNMNCVNCKKEFEGRSDAKFCSTKCRVTFNRVTDKSVTDNLSEVVTDKELFSTEHTRVVEPLDLHSTPDKHGIYLKDLMAKFKAEGKTNEELLELEYSQKNQREYNEYYYVPVRYYDMVNG